MKLLRTGTDKETNKKTIMNVNPVNLALLASTAIVVLEDLVTSNDTNAMWEAKGYPGAIQLQLTLLKQVLYASNVLEALEGLEISRDISVIV